MAERNLLSAVPRLSELTPDTLTQCLEKGLQIYQDEFNKIKNSKDAPTFDNVLRALEHSGLLYERALTALMSMAGTDSTPRLEEMEKEWETRNAAVSSKHMQDSDMFERIQKVSDEKLTPEEKDLKKRILIRMRKEGAHLSPELKSQLTELNNQEAALMTEYNQVLRRVMKESGPAFKREELEGLSDSALATAAEAAKAGGHADGYALPLSCFTLQPAMSVLRSKQAREKLMEASLCRASPDKPTWELGAKIIELRAKKAELLGFESYAAWSVSDCLAENVKNVDDLLAQVVPRVVGAANAKVAALKKLYSEMQAKEEKQQRSGLKSFEGEMTAGDLGYLEQLEKDKEAGVDSAEVAKYFELDRVVNDGLFYVARELYGLEFTENNEIPPYSDGVKVYDVYQGNPSEGRKIGVFFTDYFARSSKRGGAWMEMVVPQCKELNQLPVIVNVSNVVKPPKGEKALLTYDEVETLFHEFGHGLHGLLSDVQFPSMSGTNVMRDFVEFPSQMNEIWALDKKCLDKYARHCESNATMPETMQAQIVKSEKTTSALFSSSFFQSLIMDWELHKLKPNSDELKAAVKDLVGFEQVALEKWGLANSLIQPRYKLAYFSHIFTNSAYAAGYYNYLWADLYVASGEAWFKKSGGLKKENGSKFRELVLKRGATGDPKQLFREFTGGDPKIEDYLCAKGLDKM